MTEEKLPLWNCQTIEAVNTRDQGVSEKRPEHGGLKLKVFVKKTLRQEISIME